MRKSMGKILGTHPQPRVRGSILFALAPRNPTLPRKEEPSNRSTASRSFRHAPSAADSSLTSGALGKASISFPSLPCSVSSLHCLFSTSRSFTNRQKPKQTNFIEPPYFLFSPQPCCGNTRSTGPASLRPRRVSRKPANFSSRRSQRIPHPSSQSSSRRNRLRTRWSISARESLASAKGAARPVP